MYKRQRIEDVRMLSVIRGASSSGDPGKKSPDELMQQLELLAADAKEKSSTESTSSDSSTGSASSTPSTSPLGEEGGESESAIAESEMSGSDSEAEEEHLAKKDLSPSKTSILAKAFAVEPMDVAVQLAGKDVDSGDDSDAPNTEAKAKAKAKAKAQP